MLGELDVLRGRIGDRPWGTILAELGRARRSVELTLRADDKVFRVAFDRGQVVAARSPVAADAVTRIALTHHHITSAQVNELKRYVAAAPNLDDVDVLAAAAHLDADATRALRRSVCAQRAARTFAIDRGDYEVVARAPSAVAGAGVDIRSVIFAGARANLSEERLRANVRRLGAHLALAPGALAELAAYDFPPPVRPLLDALRTGASLATLEATHRELDGRCLLAVIYALASCDALVSSDDDRAQDHLAIAIAPPAPFAPPAPPARPARATTALEVPREPAPRGKPRDTSFAAPTLAQGTPSLATSPTATFDGPLTRALASLARDRDDDDDGTFDEPPTAMRTGFSTDPRVTTTGTPFSVAARADASAVPHPLPDSSQVTARAPTERSMIETFRTGKMTTVRPSALRKQQVIALINERTALLANGADHFALLGISIGAPIEDVHAAYVELARHLRPQRLKELGIADEAFLAQALLAQLGIAFTVLTDRFRRPEYIASLRAKRRTEQRASR